RSAPTSTHWQSFLRSFGVRRARYSALKLEKCASQEPRRWSSELGAGNTRSWKLKPRLGAGSPGSVSVSGQLQLVGFYDWR
ncbi:hypothetical protein KR009_009200, partial [Drosophila setifemur]